MNDTIKNECNIYLCDKYIVQRHVAVNFKYKVLDTFGFQINQKII